MTLPDDIVALHGISVPALQEDFGSPKIDPTYCADGSDPDIDFPLYDKEELKNGCIMSSRHVCPIECGRERVAEGIGDHFKIETDYESNIRTGVTDRWEPLQPVFISAQTGQGKNYFIENTLIPYVRELNYKNGTNQKVLILSNRLALKNQVKDRLNGDDFDDSDDKLDPIYHFGKFADVISYQSVLQREKILEDRQKKAKDRYIYVICDEAHFFTSDAMFNPHTAKILSTIVKVFQNAVRVYMSATPYECLKYIIEYEQTYQDVLNSGKVQGKYRTAQMVFYHFQRDYSYLDVKSYSSIDELFEIIVDSVNKRKEKWLIFIDDKEHGSWVKDRLLECERLRLGSSQILNGGDQNTKEDESKPKKQILVVKAESKSDKTYMEIIKKERLGKNTHVLISTSVLDNGVNLEDIDNIVVSDISKTKCLQMVGRARVSGPDDRKTLYVKRFGGDEVDRRIRSFDRQKSAYHSYNLAYGEPHNLTQPRGNSEWRFLKKYYDGSVRDWEDAKHWFGRPKDDPQKLYFNKIAESLLVKMIPQYKAIYDEMVEESQSLDEVKLEEGVNYTGQKYLEYQLSWFGKAYCADNDITFADKEKAKKEFIAFLESYATNEIQIGSEDQDKFRRDFTRLYDVAFGREDPNLGRLYGLRKMNTLLVNQKICYEIVSQSSYWEVRKCSEEDLR